MASVYTEVVYHDVLSVAAFPPTIYTVPASYRFVLVNVDLYQEQLGGNPAAVVRMSENVANRFWFACGMPVTAFSHFQWTGRQAFDAGMEIGAVANAAFVTARLTGYLLSM